MISGLTIRRFRGIAECEIAGFNNINIFVGRNNQGKSSILEALYLASAGFRPQDQLLRRENKVEYLLNRRCERGLTWNTGREILWRNYDMYTPIIIETQFREDTDLPSSEKKAVGLRFEFTESELYPLLSVPIESFPLENLPAYYLPTQEALLKFVGLDCVNNTVILQANRINLGFPEFNRLLEKIHPGLLRASVYMKGMELVDANLMHNMEKVERALWPKLLKARLDKLVTKVLREGYQVDIEDLTYMPMGAVYQLAAKLSETTIRVDDFGDGARYSMIWILIAAIARNTAILIEEPESHQHPGGLVKSLEALLDVAKKNDLQIFATTHSLEFIKFVEKIAEERKLGMSTFFVEMNEKGRIEPRIITSEDSQYLAKMGLDIRFLDIV